MNKINRLILTALLVLTFGVNAFAYTAISRIRNFVDDKNNGIPITSSYMDAELNQFVTAINGTLIVKSSAPSSPFEGEFWYDSTNKILKEYRNAEWVTIGALHVGASAPATPQAGDLWVDTGSSYALKVYNGAAWVSVSSSSFTTITTTGNVGIGTSSISGGRLLVIGGNVGIGTLTPGKELDVTGEIRASSNITGTFVGNITGNVTGNVTGTHTGAVNLNTGTLSNGTMQQGTCTTASVSNGATTFCPSGYYMAGQTRDSDGSAGTLQCCHP